MSDFSDVCQAIADDLTTNVEGLGDAKVVLFAPWSPEELSPDSSRHLGVWPWAEGEEAAPLATGAHQLNQMVAVTVWEGDATASSRQVSDEAGYRALLDLHNAVRARFYVTGNQMLGGSALVWYAGTAFPERSSAVRWFRIHVRVVRPINFT